MPVSPAHYNTLSIKIINHNFKVMNIELDDTTSLGTWVNYPYLKRIYFTHSFCA